MVARSTAQFGDCPTCQTRSAARHGWHPRVPQDLPCIGQTVRLELTVRRFRCDNPLCVRRTFVERFPGWLAVYARRTGWLTTLIRDIGFEAGGESGARLLRYSHVVASGDSILRVLRQTITVQRQAPRVIGIERSKEGEPTARSSLTLKHSLWWTSCQSAPPMVWLAGYVNSPTSRLLRAIVQPSMPTRPELVRPVRSKWPTAGTCW